MRGRKVYLVGAGPGDPGLITVKGLEILGQADVVIYDYLVDKRILERTKANAQLVCCDKLQSKVNSFIVKEVKAKIFAAVRKALAERDSGETNGS